MVYHTFFDGNALAYLFFLAVGISGLALCCRYCASLHLFALYVLTNKYNTGADV